MCDGMDEGVAFLCCYDMIRMSGRTDGWMGRLSWDGA